MHKPGMLLTLIVLVGLAGCVKDTPHLGVADNNSAVSDGQKAGHIMFISTPKFQVYDFSLKGTAGQSNPLEAGVKATFSHESGARIVNIPGFYNGGDQWIVRFSPTLEGRWTGTTTSSDPKLNGVKLPVVQCTPNTNQAVRGRLRVDPQHPQRFVMEDGKPFVPLGFECDWLFAFHQRLGQPRDKAVDRNQDFFSPAMDLIRDRGFNYVVANLYAYSGFSDPRLPFVLTPPDMYPFGGSNTEPDFKTLNVEFFKDFDKAVATLNERGLILHLMIQVQNKKVKWPKRNTPEDDMFWRYIVARYQAYSNIVWDVSKEAYNITRRQGSPDYNLSRIALIRRTDAYDHLVTVHDPDGKSWAKMSVVDKACDFVSDQIGWGAEDANGFVASAYNLAREATRRFRIQGKPYLNIEYGYELGAENIPTVIMGGKTLAWEPILLWTWSLYVGGGYPNYYYNNTSWDLVKFLPEPASWKQYKNMMDFIEKMDLNRMAPDNDFVIRGMCSAEVGKQYFVLLPAGGNDNIDLTAVPEDKTVKALWMDILTGQKTDKVMSSRTFTAPMNNPLKDTSHPCAVYIRLVDEPSSQPAGKGSTKLTSQPAKKKKSFRPTFPVATTQPGA